MQICFMVLDKPVSKMYSKNSNPYRKRALQIGMYQIRLPNNNRGTFAR
jgi:hypothetical protein